MLPVSLCWARFLFVSKQVCIFECVLRVHDVASFLCYSQNFCDRLKISELFLLTKHWDVRSYKNVSSYGWFLNLFEVSLSLSHAHSNKTVIYFFMKFSSNL